MISYRFPAAEPLLSFRIPCSLESSAWSCSTLPQKGAKTAGQGDGVHDLPGCVGSKHALGPCPLRTVRGAVGLPAVNAASWDVVEAVRTAVRDEPSSEAPREQTHHCVCLWV